MQPAATTCQFSFIHPLGRFRIYVPLLSECLSLYALQTAGESFGEHSSSKLLGICELHSNSKTLEYLQCFWKKIQMEANSRKNGTRGPICTKLDFVQKNPKISIVAAMWWNQRLLKNVTPKSFKKGQNVSTDRMGLCGAHLFERFCGFESESVKSVKIHDFKMWKHSRRKLQNEQQRWKLQGRLNVATFQKTQNRTLERVLENYEEFFLTTISCLLIGETMKCNGPLHGMEPIFWKEYCLMSL